jgi:acyl-coenzyme A synthetase/AMP-(fatty) acid ligase
MAAVLADHGVGKGDRVVLYMPMVPEAVIAMLACARLGAIHSVVFGGFAAAELATRIDDATPEARRLGRAAASSRRASSPTSRCSTRRSSLAATSRSSA